MKEVVIKPVYSAGSASVRICLDRDEMIESINQLFSNVNYYGDEINELLVQERINGVEYIVNTVSHKGIHRVTLVWRYNKIRTSEGAIVYDSCDTVNELNLGEAEMIEYAYKVADALDIQYGPVHGEYMIDEKGPVLIEVNCRPCGGGMSAEFLDRISGQHETDSILDSYLRPECFFEEARKKYGLYAHGTLKFFIVPKNMVVRSSPVVKMNLRLKSYHDSTLIDTTYQDMFFRKTEDLNTAAGYVFLVHEDKYDLYNDLNFLRSVERDAFSLILSEDSQDFVIKDDDTYLAEITPLVNRIKKQGTGLFVTDQMVEGSGILQIGHDKTDEVMGNFDFIIVNLNKSLVDKNEKEKVNIILNVFSKVKTGGYIFIPENTYRMLSSGRKGMEALIKLLNYKIEAPPANLYDVIFASRRV